MEKSAVLGNVISRQVGMPTKCMLALVAMLLIATPITAQASGNCTSIATVRIQEWTGDIINIVPWVADAEGMFRSNCLDVKFVPVVGAAAAMVALVNNTIDFANESPVTPFQSRAKGVETRIIANMYAGHWNALVASKGLSVPHAEEGYPAIMKDLVGKTIGVTALGGSTELFVRSAFEGAGMDSSSATYIAVGGVGTTVPALLNNRVDAAMMFGTGPELAEALGAGKIVLDYRKKGVGPPAVQAMWGATLCWNAYGPYIDKNPEVVAAFTKANNEAISWIQDLRNRDELYKVVAKHMPMPENIPNPEQTLKAIVDVNASVVGTDIPRSAIEGWNEFLVHLKQIESPIPYEEIVWKTARP